MIFVWWFFLATMRLLRAPGAVAQLARAQAARDRNVFEPVILNYRGTDTVEIEGVLYIQIDDQVYGVPAGPAVAPGYGEGGWE